MANAFLLKPLTPVSIALAGLQPSFDFTTAALPAGAALSRASAGTRWNAAGSLVSEAANVARFDYSAAGALLGLLVEPARINYVPNSSVMSGSTVASDVSLAPDGTMTADKIGEDTSTGYHHIAQQSAAPSGARLARSSFVKAAGRNFAAVTCFASNTAYISAGFSITTGAACFSIAGSNGSLDNASATLLPGAYARLAVCGSLSASPPYAAVSPMPASNTTIDGNYGLPTYTGDGTSGVVTWGHQIEAIGAGERVEASTYIPTSGGSGTRAADVLTLNWGSLGVADGSATVRYTFDDGSTQDVASAIASGSMTVPTNLARARIRRVDLISPAVFALGAAPAVGAMTNLLVDYAGVIAQMTCSTGSANAAVFVVDLGSDTVLDTALVFGVELFPKTGLLTIDYATSAQGQFTGAYTTDASGVAYAGAAATTSGKGVSLWTLAQPVTARYLRFTYAAGANMGGSSIRASRLVIGKRIQLGRNFSYGASFGVRDLGSLDFSRRGVLLRVRGAKLRTVQLTFSNIQKDEVEASTKPLLEQIGNTETIALVTDPTADPQRQNRCYFGPLVGDLAHTWRNARAFEAKANLVSLF